jgi:hypothetical protein
MLMLSRELQSVRPHFGAVDGRYKDDRRTAVEESLYPPGNYLYPRALTQSKPAVGNA